MQHPLKLATLIVALIATNWAYSQELTVSNDDISQYLVTVGPYTELIKELQAMTDPTPEQMMTGKQKMEQLLAENGWEDDYTSKSNAILQLYGLINAEKEAQSMDDEYKEERLNALKDEADKFTTRYGAQSIENVRNRHEELAKVLGALM